MTHIHGPPIQGNSEVNHHRQTGAGEMQDCYFSRFLECWDERSITAPQDDLTNMSLPGTSEFPDYNTTSASQGNGNPKNGEAIIRRARRDDPGFGVGSGSLSRVSRTAAYDGTKGKEAWWRRGDSRATTLVGDMDEDVDVTGAVRCGGLALIAVNSLMLEGKARAPRTKKRVVRRMGRIFRRLFGRMRNVLG